jgi:hypothetical protein
MKFQDEELHRLKAVFYETISFLMDIHRNIKTSRSIPDLISAQGQNGPKQRERPAGQYGLFLAFKKGWRNFLARFEIRREASRPPGRPFGRQ